MTILVGLDTSTQSAAVLREAATLAEARGTRLWILHAVEIPPTLPSNLWAVSTDQIVEHCLGAARTVVDELVGTIPKERVAGTRIRVGIPWREVCNEAVERNVEMIVIGAHGHGIVDRFLGTTAAKIVNHADRTVLVVRPPEDASATPVTKR